MELQARPQKAGTHAAVDPASHKLLNSPSTQPEHTHASHRGSVKFRVVGQMVLALKRFQNALNPTYSYGEGKEVAKENPRTPVIIYHAQQPQPTTIVGRLLSGRTGSGRTGSGRTSSGRPSEVGKQHGHKGDLLFKPLPAPEVQS